MWLPLPFIQTTGSVDDGIDSSAALAGWFEDPSYYLQFGVAAPNFTGASDTTPILSVLYEARSPFELHPAWYEGGLYVDQNWEPAEDSVVVGAVSDAASATAVDAVLGTQAYAGAVSAASTATATSAPAGTQGYAGAVSAASTATAASAPSGTQAYVGAVSAASTATSVSTAAGALVFDGVVDNAASPTVVQSVVGALAAVQSQVGGASRVPRRRQAQQGRGFGFTHDAPQPTADELLQQAAIARAVMNTRFLTLHLLTH